MKELIKRVKEKKELRGISDSLIEDVLSKYLKKKKEFSEKEKKIIIKEARAELRNYVGRFQRSGKKKLEFLKKGDYKQLIRTHSSTKEREEIYPALIKVINDFDPKSIIDLGCGINPVFILKEFKRSPRYYAFDINKDDLDIVEYFFKKEGINGKVFLQDIRKAKDFPEADLALILKTLDIIEKNGRVAEKILSNLKCKNIIASFSTKTLSGKAMMKPRRIWFENLLKKRFGYSFKILKTKNEIFYLIDA